MLRNNVEPSDNIKMKPRNQNKYVMTNQEIIQELHDLQKHPPPNCLEYSKMMIIIIREWRATMIGPSGTPLTVHVMFYLPFSLYSLNVTLTVQYNNPSQLNAPDNAENMIVLPGCGQRDTRERNNNSF